MSDTIQKKMDPVAARDLRAAQLLKMYAVYGHFYQLSWNGSDGLGCRSVLELVAHDRLPKNRQELLLRQADLVAVMMNPGSSHPIDRGYAPPLVTQDGQSVADYRLTPTRPDNTQYQILRILAARGWHHARILNLSDLREPKSPLFLQQVARLEREGQVGGRHSIFCPERQAELLPLLGQPGAAPVLVGWGRHAGLIPLAEQCLDRLRNHFLVGVPVAGESRLYAHPSPMLQRMKDAWLDAVLEQLSKNKDV
ncbi:MAG: hypothetical protein H7833_08040 [Magnetococcus sp. DMHC-1]|nr:hypothetical protein [Magnetococcales bacterium]